MNTFFLFQSDLNSLSQSCYYHIRQLCCICPNLDFKTASTTATSIIPSKLDYCNSLYYNLSKSQITRLQQIQNSLARAVVKAPKFYHITPILHSLHWLKITECIEYKILSLTYKVLTSAQPSYLHHLINVQPHRSIRFSSVVTLSHPPSLSSLRITNRSFHYASPRLQNQLPASLWQFSLTALCWSLHLGLWSCYACQFRSFHKFNTLIIHNSFTLSHPAQNLPPLSFYRPDDPPAAQPTASKHWRQIRYSSNTVN